MAQIKVKAPLLRFSKCNCNRQMSFAQQKELNNNMITVFRFLTSLGLTPKHTRAYATWETYATDAQILQIKAFNLVESVR